MNPSINTAIDDWAKAPTSYSFEKRLHIPINVSQISDNAPFVEFNFIIEVSGFFLDKECKQPVKLHHERVISIDRNNMDSQYVEDFRKDLKLLTATAYAEFEKILSSQPQPTYTSDPRFMK